MSGWLLNIFSSIILYLYAHNMIFRIVRKYEMSKVYRDFSNKGHYNTYWYPHVHTQVTILFSLPFVESNLMRSTVVFFFHFDLSHSGECFISIGSRIGWFKKYRSSVEDECHPFLFPAGSRGWYDYVIFYKWARKRHISLIVFLWQCGWSDYVALGYNR